MNDDNEVFALEAMKIMNMFFFSPTHFLMLHPNVLGFYSQYGSNHYWMSYFSDESNYVRSFMFDCSKPNMWCSSSITKRWTRLSLFDVQKMMFVFVWCSIKWFSNHHHYRIHILKWQNCELVVVNIFLLLSKIKRMFI